MATLHWTDARAELKKMRETQERSPSKVMRLAVPLIDTSAHKLGDEGERVATHTPFTPFLSSRRSILSAPVSQLCLSLMRMLRACSCTALVGTALAMSDVLI
jgi:hypothetical protein